MIDYDNRIIKFKISIYEHNTFLIDLLLKKYEFYSREEWENFIALGNLNIDDKMQLENIAVKLNQGIILKFPNSYEPKVNKNYSIFYEDEFLLIINKPSNLPMHPTGRYHGNTLINLLKKKYDENLWIVNRLDRDTSGLCIIAKEKNVLTNLQEQFLWNKVKKKYNLIVIEEINNKEFTINKRLKDINSKTTNKKTIIDPYGKEAETYFEVVETNKFTIHEGNIKYQYPFTVLNAYPKQGRTHQIRVHISSVGYPILNDKIYSKNFCILNEQMYLKCTYMKFEHPKKGNVEFKIPDFEYTDLQF